MMLQPEKKRTMSLCDSKAAFFNVLVLFSMKEKQKTQLPLEAMVIAATYRTKKLPAYCV